MSADQRIIDLATVRQPDSRAIAVERAMAEAQAVARAQDIDRIRQELQAISQIRKVRIADSVAGRRRRLVAVAVASGIICASAGYLIGTHASSNVQVHIVKREPEPITVTAPTPLLAAATTTASTPAAETTLTVVTQKSAQPAQVSVPVQRLAVPLSTSAAPVQSKTVVTQRPSIASSKDQLAKPSLQAPMPVKVQPGVQSFASATPRAIEPKVTKATDDNEIVITPRQQKSVDTKAKTVESPATPLTSATSPPTVPVTTANSAFQVVNVLEGTVVVRQGQSVRQVKIGEKMPDGQVLRSVNVDKGQFETLPR